MSTRKPYDPTIPLRGGHWVNVRGIMRWQGPRPADPPELVQAPDPADVACPGAGPSSANGAAPPTGPA